MWISSVFLRLSEYIDRVSEPALGMTTPHDFRWYTEKTWTAIGTKTQCTVGQGLGAT